MKVPLQNSRFMFNCPSDAVTSYRRTSSQESTAAPAPPPGGISLGHTRGRGPGTTVPGRQRVAPLQAGEAPPGRGARWDG